MRNGLRESHSPRAIGDETERQILALMGRDYWFWQIAEALSIDEKALDDRVAGIQNRLGLHTWRELYKFAAAHPKPFSRSAACGLSEPESTVPLWD